MDLSTTSVEDATHDELLALAQERDIEGRSSMSKEELYTALQEGEVDEAAVRPTASRFEAFRSLAQARARGEMVMLPRHLHGNDRKLHVRQTIREDHETRIASANDDAEEKFKKLAGSLFSFFRGNCLLFYRDLAGEDAWMPTVLTLGDVHPENFGIMPNADNVPIFGVNDFDEAYYAPFTWDLKRGAVGFMIGAQEEGGLGRSKQRKIARHFVKGYIDGITTYANDETEQDEQLRLDNSPKLIRKLIEDALESRRDWLADDYLGEYQRAFRPSKKIVPVSHLCEVFQALMHRLVKENGIVVPERAADLRVKDVAIRRGQGTASLGLERYYVLIEGPRADGTDDLIIEFKQARRSALAGLVPPSEFTVEGQGHRISHAQGVHLVGGDRFYGGIDINGKGFMTRERAPYRNSIDCDELSKKSWRKYAKICGRTLAHAHALSDETGVLDYDIEPKIVEAMGNEQLFIDDILTFAEESADRVRQDHEYFKADYRLGAFRTVDVVYR
jgi:uncharacterized protein (DUF2252 family)